MKKNTKEWTLKFPWGKVAMVSWGSSAKPPILLLHGYMDSAATFIPLIEALPDDYYYVAFDIPGNGKSDPFPPGLIVSHLHIVEVIRGVVEQIKWKSFIYISHSLGFIIGAFYNHLYPGKIKKMVHLDPGPPLSFYYYSHYKPEYWYQFIYDNFYNSFTNVMSPLRNMGFPYNYTLTRWTEGDSREMTRDEIISLIIRHRDLTEEQAEIIISRCLIPTGEGKFRLSWDSRMKKIASVPLSEETLYTVITEHTPPVLFIEASENKSVNPGKRFAANILEKCRLMQPNCSSVTVPGGHDVHITNPEVIVPHVIDFLKGSGVYKKSKL